MDVRHQVIARLVAEGATKVGSVHVVPRVPYCDAPVGLELTGRRQDRSDLRFDVYDPESGGGVDAAVMLVPCRKCAKCRVVRGLQWRERMMFETIASPSTWFVTWTLSTPARTQLLETALQRYGSTAPDALCSVVREWHQSAMKRLRQRVFQKGRLRFAAVVEHHKDGYPHIHMLVHGVFTYRDLKGSWGKGFEDIRRVDEYASNYLTKYVMKEGGVIWASKHYGKPAAAGSKNARGVKDEHPGKAKREKIDPKTSPRLTSSTKGELISEPETGRGLFAASRASGCEPNTDGVDLDSPLDTFLAIEALYSGCGACLDEQPGLALPRQPGPSELGMARQRPEQGGAAGPTPATTTKKAKGAAGKEAKAPKGRKAKTSDSSDASVAVAHTEGSESVTASTVAVVDEEADPSLDASGS